MGREIPSSSWDCLFVCRRSLFFSLALCCASVSQALAVLSGVAMEAQAHVRHHHWDRDSGTVIVDLALTSSPKQSM